MSEDKILITPAMGQLMKIRPVEIPERFWVKFKHYNDETKMLTGIVANNLLCGAFKVGDEIEFAEDEIIDIGVV